MTSDEKQERLHNYSTILAKRYKTESLYGAGTHGIPLHEYHIVEENRKRRFIVYDQIDPCSMQSYRDTPDEEIVIIIDADNLPEEDRKDAHNLGGLPPMALVVAIRVDAHILRGNKLMQLLSDTDVDGMHVTNFSIK